MNAARNAKQADSAVSQLLYPLFARLERFMGRLGMIAFIDEPGATSTAAPPADTTLMGSEPPAATTAPVASPEPTTAPVASPQPTAAPVASPAPTAAPKAAEGAPEKYEDFKLPDTVKLDEPVMNEFAALAKEANLPQDVAQKFVDLAAKMQTGTVTGMQSALEAQSTQWAGEAKADKEYGGDKFSENLALAVKAREAFGTPELKALLDSSKLGNHPEVIRFFVRAGKAISQDGFVPGRQGGARPSTAEVLYPSSQG